MSLAASVEVAWRAWGLPAAIVDGDAGWIAARDRVRPESTVFLGASRMQSAVDPAVWREMTGRHTVQLALPASSPLPVLQDLAADEAFKGQVVAEVLTAVLFNVGYEAYMSRPRETVAGFRDYTAWWRHPSAWMEPRLAYPLSGRLAAQNPQVSPNQLLRRLGRGDDDWGNLKYRNVRNDRFAAADFTAIDVKRREIGNRDAFRGRGRPASPAERDSVIAELGRAIDAIRERGGSVVLVRLPVCGLALELEDEEYPLDTYWDALRQSLSAPTIDFADHPDLSPEQCYDGSHIDYRLSTDFTRALVRIVSEGTADSVPLDDYSGGGPTRP